jgi:hypothetical protein
MAIFEEITLTWAGADYTIEPNKVMGAIARIEEVITLKELGEYAQKGDAPMAKLAMAFAAVLRYAGARVSEEEVYAAMFSKEGQTSAMASISTLLTMMIPPNAFKQTQSGKAQAVPTGGKNSSKKRIS